jgi:hypothetical protein
MRNSLKWQHKRMESMPTPNSLTHSHSRFCTTCRTGRQHRLKTPDYQTAQMGWRYRLLCWHKREPITPAERRSRSCYRYGFSVLKKTDQAEYILFSFTGCKLLCREPKQVKVHKNLHLWGRKFAEYPTLDKHICAKIAGKAFNNLCTSTSMLPPAIDLIRVAWQK